MIAILREFDTRGKWISRSATAIQLLAAAGLMKGRRFTCYEHVRFEVEAVGGQFVKTDVVRDGRLVSCPTWREQPDFYREVFACLQQPVTA